MAKFKRIIDAFIDRFASSLGVLAAIALILWFMGFVVDIDMKIDTTKGEAEVTLEVH